MFTPKAKPNNGALLNARGEIHGNQLTIKWTLSYDGPRSPLILLGPTLTHATGQTTVRIYAVGKDGRTYYVPFSSPIGGCAYYSSKDWFIIVPRGQNAEGELTVDLSSLKTRFVEMYNKKQVLFDDSVPPAFAWILDHHTGDRGGVHGLDAWTGELWSEFTPLSFDNW